MFYLLYEHYAADHAAYIPTSSTCCGTRRCAWAWRWSPRCWWPWGMGSRFIAWMRAKQGKGQPIRADGIERHLLTKKAARPPWAA